MVAFMVERGDSSRSKSQSSQKPFIKTNYYSQTNLKFRGFKIIITQWSNKIGSIFDPLQLLPQKTEETLHYLSLPQSSLSFWPAGWDRSLVFSTRHRIKSNRAQVKINYTLNRCFIDVGMWKNLLSLYNWHRTDPYFELCKSGKSYFKMGGRRDQSGKFQQSLKIFSDIIYFSCNVFSHCSWLFLY